MRPSQWPGARGTPTAAYLAPALALYGLFVLWPLVQVFRLALVRWNGYGPQTYIGLANVPALWSDGVFRAALDHSALWEVAAALVPAVLGLGLALLLQAARARSLFLTALFFPVLLPATVVAGVWLLVYSPLWGLLNICLRAVGLGALAGDWLGDPHLALGALFVAWLWSAVGVAALLFWAGLRVIGREWAELALTEGAGALWRFGHITLPALRRTIVVVLLVDAALGAQVFDLIFVTTGGGPGYATMLLPLDMYGRAFGGQTGEGAATACVQVALGLILTLLALLLLRKADHGFDTGSGPAGPLIRGSRPVSTALLGIFLAVLLLPLAWLLVAAVEPGRVFALHAAPPALDPRLWDWGNFGAAWDAGMASAVATSLLLGCAAVAATLLVGAPAAFALTHLAGRVWRYGLLALLLVGLLQPTPVLLIPLFSLLRDLGLLDSAWGVLLPEVARTLPFAVLVLWGYLSQSPREILDAARVDGASPSQLMLRVALPLARPALYAVAVWSFVTSWNEYLLPTVVSQDGSLQTVPTLLATFIGRYDTQYGLLAAGSLMALAPSLIIYLALRRPAGRGMEQVVK
jgi:raffinose/stachyose/melibiose transport system permease protein